MFTDYKEIIVDFEVKVGWRTLGYTRCVNVTNPEEMQSYIEILASNGNHETEWFISYCNGFGSYKGNFDNDLNKVCEAAKIIKQLGEHEFCILVKRFNNNIDKIIKYFKENNNVLSN